MGLFDFNLKNEKEEIEDEKLEEEMDAYGLEDAEKELVRKGEYNPWDFDVDGDLEDDDYYKDDWDE